MNKRILTLTLALLTVIGATTFTSCKKGENDPFFSLRTRKSRLAGDWTLESGSMSDTYTSGGTTNTSNFSFSNGSATVTSGGSSYSYPFTVKFTINKDNTFERVINDDGDVTTEKGSWAFVKKNKELDLKNKEAILITISSIVDQYGSNTYTGTQPDEMLVLDQLKNKEMIIKSESTSTSTGGSTSSYTSELTFVQ